MWMLFYVMWILTPVKGHVSETNKVCMEHNLRFLFLRHLDAVKRIPQYIPDVLECILVLFIKENMCMCVCVLHCCMTVCAFSGLFVYKHICVYPVAVGNVEGRVRELKLRLGHRKEERDSQ